MALLAELYPTEPPTEDEAWRDEKAIWARVAELRPRLALVLRCRFGQYGPRPLTLIQTSEVVADELDMDEVSAERIRQLQVRALRQLRTKSTARVRATRRAAGLPDPPKVPRSSKPAAPAIAAIDRDSLRSLVVDILRATGSHPVSPSMVCHILRGSNGPVTRQLVGRFTIPHDGALQALPFQPLREAVLELVASPPFRSTSEGRLRLEGRQREAVP